MKKGIKNDLKVWAILIVMLSAIFIGHRCNAQVSDDWGKWNKKDTIYARLNAHEAHQRYASKKARVTRVTYMFPRDNYCADHAIGIVGNILTKDFGVRYDYLPHKANSLYSIGFYASVVKFSNWKYDKPSWDVFSMPIIPENTSHTTTTYSVGKLKYTPDPDPNPDPCPECPECPECEPEYIYVHDTAWVHTVNNNYIYIPPDVQTITADERIRITVGPSFHWNYYWHWYLSAGVCISGHVSDNSFIVPFNQPDLTPISFEFGFAAELPYSLIGVQYETKFDALLMSIQYRF